MDLSFGAHSAQQQQQRRNVIVNNSSSKSTADESELSKLQRGRVIDRGLRNGDLAALGLTSPFLRTPYGPLPHHLFPQQQSPNAALNHIVNSIGAGIHPAAAAAAASSSTAGASWARRCASAAPHASPSQGTHATAPASAAGSAQLW